MKKIGSWNSIDFQKEEITIKKGNASVSVFPRFNVVTGWNVNGWDVLYRPVETGNLMRAGLPVMVPNFSSLKDKKFNETGTSLPHHGFGRVKAWKECERRDDGIAFELGWDEETLAQYPFKFSFIVDVSLTEEGDLIHRLTMKNLETDKILPVQPGLHPYFTCKGGPEIKKQIGVQGVEGFKASDWKWLEPSNTPDNNYEFPTSGVVVKIPNHGTITMKEVPESANGNSGDDRTKHYYQRIQIWSERFDAPDHDFVCFEPVVWGADGLNNPDHRINVPASSSITITMKFSAKKE